MAIMESIHRMAGHSHFKCLRKLKHPKRSKKLMGKEKHRENVFDRIKDSLRKQLKGKPMPASTFYGVHPSGVNFNVKKGDDVSDRRLYDSINRLKGNSDRRDIFGGKKKRKRDESSIILENNRRVLRIRNGDKNVKGKKKALV